ncbi:Protein frg1 [Sphaceloma murrayae]|uniref:Protein frg1 n=1 Tax=Sphaceloma murrayae TaxID=2082308 RepID=A0A2K1QTC5_9PEZI|nr:Protein frg1 [Sphaceloma murrayae]
MPKPLTFKGNARLKKRKRAVSPSGPSSLSQPEAVAHDASEAGDWVHPDQPSDISGPVLVIFPTTSPTTCLASDANGAVFASKVENMVEGAAGSAEPSEVRQVWVANRVVGSAEVGFRGSHGRYLGVDGAGKAEAVREARGVEEGFEIVKGGVREIDEQDGTEEKGKEEEEEEEEEEDGLVAVDTLAPIFHLKDAKGRYLTATPSPLDESKIVIQAKRDRVTAASAVIIRMQAKFKPKLEQAKKERAYEKIGRAQIEREAGRTLKDDEVKRLKKARRKGTYHEEMLDVRAKGKHDKFA